MSNSRNSDLDNAFFDELEDIITLTAILPDLPILSTALTFTPYTPGFYLKSWDLKVLSLRKHETPSNEICTKPFSMPGEVELHTHTSNAKEIGLFGESKSSSPIMRTFEPITQKLPSVSKKQDIPLLKLFSKSSVSGLHAKRCLQKKIIVDLDKAFATGDEEYFPSSAKRMRHKK